MAFTQSITKTIHGVNGKLVLGTYANAGGTTGGDLATGLSTIYSISLTPAAAAVTNAHVYNETFPLSDGVVTIITGANESGAFIALGE